MKRLTVWIVLCPLVFLLNCSIALSAALDDYYLEGFGEKARQESHIAGVLTTAGEAPFEPCRTPLQHGLRRDWSKLAVGTQQILAKYLAKPTLTGTPIPPFLSAGGHFNIHYASSGSDAPPAGDANGNGIPDWVEKVASVFEEVYSGEVLVMGYSPAPTGGGKPYDVYLQDLGNRTPQYLGETTSDTLLTATSAASFISIDNDFVEFPGYTPEEYLKITAAHEYHHAIQYGYNYYFDAWYAEATSTWIEDEVFDAVNQLYGYLPAYLQNLQLALDCQPASVTKGCGYGRWILNRYLVEMKGRDFIKSIWELLQRKPRPADGSDIPMIPVLDEALGGKLDQHVLGLGRRFVLRDWTTHQQDTYLIHPFIAQAGVSPLPASSFPTLPYSLAFFSYPPGQSVNLSARPATVLSDSVSTSGADILILCNNSVAVVSAPNSSGGGGGCFIATAAYGSYLHPKVRLLRDFRDRWLMTNPLGRLFVRAYYHMSPPAAAVMARHEWLRRLCRVMLEPVVLTVEFPELPAAFIVGLTGWLLARRRGPVAVR
jgi:hypothetical protein